jgi:hypothetical protein
MKITVSGPDADEVKDSPEIGLSFAITKANEAAQRREETTYYVRDEEGHVVGTASSHADGSVDVFGQLAVAQKMAEAVS